MNLDSRGPNASGEEPALSAEQPTNVRWLVFSLACGTSWFLYLHRYTFALIKPKLEAEWGLDVVELGWLDFAFSITYSVCQVPSGIAGDLLGTHLFLGAIIIAWAASLALHAWAPRVEFLYGVRVLFGITQAGCYPTLSKISRIWFPRSIRTTLQGWIASFFGRIGGASANIIFATILIGWFGLGWRISLVCLAVAGGLFGLVFAWRYRNTPREHPQANEAEARLIEVEELALTGGRPIPERRVTFREMFAGMSPRSVRNFSCFVIQQFSSTFADSIYVAWIPFFLAKEHGLDYEEMGIYSALPLLGGACGGAFGGFLNDFLIRTTGNRRWSRSGVGLCGKGVACALVFFALLIYDSPRLFCVVLFFVKFFSDWSQPTVWGTVTDIGGKATATVFAFNNMVGGFGGNLSPVVFGYVAKYYSWTVVFTLVGAAYLISALSWLLVDCTIPLIGQVNNESQSDADAG